MTTLSYLKCSFGHFLLDDLFHNARDLPAPDERRLQALLQQRLGEPIVYLEEHYLLAVGSDSHGHARNGPTLRVLFSLRQV